MMTLVALAISVALVYSLATSFSFPGEPFFWELTTLIVVMLLGHWLEMRAVGRPQRALEALGRLLPATAERVEPDGSLREVPIAELRPDDVVLVRPGSRIPADGIALEGESEIDEAAVTGESRPVLKQPGSTVIGGTVNGPGLLRARVTRVGSESFLGQVLQLVARAQAERTRLQALADRVAFWLTVVARSVSALTFATWLISDGVTTAIARAVTVLVVACPHALGLAIPLVVTLATGLSARNGILIRDRQAFERARTVDTVVFDKTGTLTRGEFAIVDVALAPGCTEEHALALAAAVEHGSEHPIARAILRRAAERSLVLPEAAEVRAIPGRGVMARIGRQRVTVGRLGLLDHRPDWFVPALARWEAHGMTIAVLLVENEPRAAFALADELRPESREAVAQLHRLGISAAMLTGDQQAVASWVARELGIDQFMAEVLPEDKQRVIRQLRQEGHVVAMVGDGINDAPALVAADLGIAIGAGTDIAIESADVVLVRNDPRDVVTVLELSRCTYRKMIENLAWALGYNVVALPLAAGVLAPYGIALPPALAALLKSLSTVIVALNALTLRLGVTATPAPLEAVPHPH
ncbi:MAG: heavy metal translocating P-type ATPase [Thermomicrobium sp.]|nr:heavy metal translocating P-type ATPase [Thermomicrobium sp.]